MSLHALRFGGVVAGILVLIGIGHAMLFHWLRVLAEDARKYLLIHAMRRPILLMLLIGALLLILPSAPISGGVRESLEHALDLGLIAGAAWMLAVFGNALIDTFALRYRLDVADNLLARRIRTRLQVFHHIFLALLVLLAVAVGLMTFPNVRSLGASLLASAGLAGIVVGMAARPALSNFIAGLQIALTEPIRIDDVVIVEGEWGNIEEIYATYVVVKIWDLRRMILPLSYFIEHPFQNWTRTSADILGSVFLYTDYRVPVDALRSELQRILKSTPLWRGQVAVLQVTDATEHAVQLRALMDSTNSSQSWDLRCLVREKLIAYLQTHYPDSLPRTRVDLEAVSAPVTSFFAPLSKKEAS